MFRRLDTFILLSIIVLTIVVLETAAMQHERSLDAYTDDFESRGSAHTGPGIAFEWVPADVSSSRSGRKFLGQFANQDVSLRLRGLPMHSRVSLSFDLYVIGNWDGNGNATMLGPDIWELSAGGGSPGILMRSLAHTTFSNYRSWADPAQAYPGRYPGGSNNGCTGAAEVGTLGYGDHNDSVYHLTYEFAHEATALALKFSSRVSSPEQEKFGIDNIRVTLRYEGRDATHAPHVPSEAGRRKDIQTPDLVLVQGADLIAEATCGHWESGLFVDIMIKNIGNRPSPASVSTIKMDGAFGSPQYLKAPPLDPGGFYKQRRLFSASCPTPDCRFTILVDHAGNIPELNEANNTLTSSCRSLGPIREPPSRRKNP